MPASLDPDSSAPVASRRGRGVELRALLLLALMVLILAGTAIYLMWARGAFEPTQPLYLTADDSDGVVVGMDLTFSGFPIGRVRDTELAPDGSVRIRVDVAKKDAHWLRDSSVFTLERGLVGAARLRAFTGVPDAPKLAAGAERPVLRGDVSAEIPRMVADAREVLQNVARLTGADSPLRGTLDQVNQLAARLNGKDGLVAALTGSEGDAKRVAQVLQHVDELVQRLNRIAADANRQVLGKGGLVPGARASVTQVDALLKQLQNTLVNVRDVLRQADAAMQNVRGITADVRGATPDLDALRAQLEASLDKVSGMIDTLGGKWPFAPGEKQVDLP